MSWFTVEQLEPDTFAISEYRHWEETHCYLLLGKESAVLIDTGLGVADISQPVRSITRLPIQSSPPTPISTTSAGMGILTTSPSTGWRPPGWTAISP